MSFLKITDPVKRDQIVKEYLEIKKKIRDSQLAEKTGEIELQTGLSKIFKPITETQREATKEITEGLKPIKEGIEQLPQQQASIKLPNYPTIEAWTTEGQVPTFGEREWWKDEPSHIIGPLAKEYLTKFVSKTDVDKTYGLHDKGGKFYICDKLVVLDDDDIEVGDRYYKGTPGLWELIVAKVPDKNIYKDRDLDEYTKLMIQTNAIYRDNNPDSKYPKASKGTKWYKILRPIWGNIRALLERLDLLMASKEAGNTGLRNELVRICDELKRQGVLDSSRYKNLMSIL